jgi:putative Mn2+ efflux pump MntP
MLIKLIGLVIPLGLDTFAVSAALGMNPIPARRKLMISLFFTAFEAGMPLVGLLAGEPLHRLIGSSADTVAYLILIAFGLYTLLHQKDEEPGKADSILQNWGLGAIILGISISIDEIAIGLTLGLLGFPIAPVLIAIGVQAFIFSQLGFWLGGRLSEKFREKTEWLAGLALIAIGVVLLAEKIIK